MIHSIRLHHLAHRAIATSSALTAACVAGQAISASDHARIDDEADAARRDLLDCLDRDYGIDQAMAGQLAALL